MPPRCARVCARTLARSWITWMNGADTTQHTTPQPLAALTIYSSPYTSQPSAVAVLAQNPLHACSTCLPLLLATVAALHCRSPTTDSAQLATHRTRLTLHHHPHELIAIAVPYCRAPAAPQ